MQCIGCLDIALLRYDQLAKKKSAYMDNTDQTIESIILKGLSLHELVMRANNMFGGIILMEYGFSLFFATFGIYFSTTIFNVYIKELAWVNEMVLVFSLVNICLFLLMIYKLYMMQSKGQVLCNHFAAIKDDLEGMSIIFARYLGLEDEKRLGVLISRFSAASSPIRPCDVFNVNTSSFISMSGIILTYLVVLLQFKLSVGSYDNPTNITLVDLPWLLENKTIADLQALVQN